MQQCSAQQRSFSNWKPYLTIIASNEIKFNVFLCVTMINLSTKFDNSTFKIVDNKMAHRHQRPHWQQWQQQQTIHDYIGSFRLWSSEPKTLSIWMSSESDLNDIFAAQLFFRCRWLMNFFWKIGSLLIDKQKLVENIKWFMELFHFILHFKQQ